MSSKKPLIGIVGGKGRMGNWFRGFFENQKLKVLVSSIDTELTNIELAKKADIVMVAVPLEKTCGVIKEIRNSVRKSALLCDIASLKSEPVKELKKAKSGALGMHPLFGPLVQDLAGQNIVFCEIRNNKWVSFLRNLFRRKGARIVNVLPADHDRQMALTQALVHFSNISLARTPFLSKSNFKNSFFTPLFKLQNLIIGRILAQNPKLYAAIEMENPFFLEALAALEKEIKDLGRNVKDKNYQKFIKKFQEVSFSLTGLKKIAETKTTEILRVIERHPLRLQKQKAKMSLGKKIKIGFLGPVGTFSHQTAADIFSGKKELFPFATIKDVFEATNNQEVDLGIVPAENTTTGIVSETISCLIEYPLEVTGSFNLSVHQCLLGRTRNKKEIKIVRSHQQALSQCRNWLRENLPWARLEKAPSTTASILETKDKKIGFIASFFAAKVYNLNILGRNIEDAKENVTKFYFISPQITLEIQKSLKAKKTLLLLAVYDRVGILRDILNVFARESLNLTALHSIPSCLRPWDYFFFLEVEVLFPSQKIKKVLKELEEYCSIIRVIGVS